MAAKSGIENKAWDEDGIPLEDTNCAGIGGEENKALNKASAQMEPAWHGIGMEPGLWLFRIEMFQVVAWPKDQYGTFYDGDSYICLHTIMEEVEQGDGKLVRDIYFWLGKHTSIDEKGTAAYKTVELDNFFDGEPIQHREVQGSESKPFLALFGGEIKYMKGGCESGFKVVQKDIFTNKLWQVRKEKRKVIIEEENCTRAILNHRDCFILCTGRKIFTFFGDETTPFLKQACNTKAENMEAASNGEMSVFNEIDEDFWKAVGGEGPITPADQVGEEVEADYGEGILYKCDVNEARELEVIEVGRGDLRSAMLDTTSVMMLDTRAELIMWLGKEASEIEKRIAMSTAKNYLKMNNRPFDKTPVSMIKEGQEERNALWVSTFSD